MDVSQLARNAGIVLGIVAFAYAALCAVLFVTQRSMIYYPPSDTAQNRDNVLTLRVPGAELRVSIQARAGPKALIYFGGNAEDVSLGLPAFAAAFPDRSLFFLHYRGYGGSTGTPTEQAIYQDATALFDRVHTEYPDVAVVGRSLGSGVAVRLAGCRPVSSLVLVTPYSSIEDVAAQQFPFLPIAWLLQDKYESWRYAAAIRARTLLLAAADDRVIPHTSTQKLLAAFPPGVASLRIIPGVGHNDISASNDYLAAIASVVSPPSH